MATLAWDRLFQTLVKHGGVGLLVAGAPPVVRDEYGPRIALLPPLTAEDIRLMFNEQEADPAEVIRRTGHSVVEVGFGDAYKFQITAIGEPSPWAVILVEKDVARPLPPERSRRGEQIWLDPRWSTTPGHFLGGTKPDSVWAAGCPPLVRGDDGVVAAKAAPLTEADLVEMTTEIQRYSTSAESSDGFASMRMRYGSADGELFTISVFGGATPSLLMFIRWPNDTPEASAGS